MIQPTKWNTDIMTKLPKLLLLSLKRGEATRITDAIGVVNNSIRRLEQLFHQADRDLTAKKNYEETAPMLSWLREKQL